jgi:aminopeptidase N
MKKYRTLTKIIFPALILTVLTNCSLLKPTDDAPEHVVYLDTVDVFNEPPVYPYRPSETRKWDLLHTQLDVRFDWEKQYLYGKAELTLTPYFYSTDELILDAKGFDVNEVSLVQGNERTEIPFTYDGNFITASLPTTYTRTDTTTLFIEYTAKPNELEVEGGSAITDAKGLYFINPLGEEKGKPMQIWTQGEVEASSCWFPTIDAPNERTTQEICITVQEKFKTLSNGNLEFSTQNGNGTRTDCWVQKKPHAPYLFMMAVGDFSVTKEMHHDTLELSYYVEPEYGPYAKDIFGKTGQMIDVYSNLLGVDYPWDKYAQVVVRDYVSGAMENTSAVIFGEFAQRTKRELIDDSPEDVIAHELFHHWFGDLVTCESWSNLPLNESFATYGEYLWREAAYGRAMADIHLQEDLNGYLYEFKSGKSVDLVRFHYDKPDDMFDSHSYAKGGRILHMLRKYVGDEAFFEGLKLYLNQNAYKPAEMHHLRLVMEEITGEDLNWFFNQWFFDKGHPRLRVSYDYNDSLKQQIIHVEQLQNTEEYPTYKLPIDIDLYYSGNRTERKRIEVTSADTFIALPVLEKPMAVDFDAEKMLLAEIEDLMPIDWHLTLYDRSNLYITERNAVQAFGVHATKNQTARKALFNAVNNPFYGVRLEVLKQAELLYQLNEEKTTLLMDSLAFNDPKSKVRAEALLATLDFGTPNAAVVEKALEDSSYLVVISAMETLFEIDSVQAINKAEQFKDDPNMELRLMCAELFALSGNPGYANFFNVLDEELTGFDRISYYALLPIYVLNTEDEAIIDAAVPRLEKGALSKSAWYVRYYAIAGLQQIEGYYASLAADAKNEEDKQKYANKKSGIADVLSNVAANTREDQLKMLLNNGYE